MGALFPLPVRAPGEVCLLQASKWIKYPVLLDLLEMEDLLDTLFPYHMLVVCEPVLGSQIEIQKEEFLTLYAEYVTSLQEGKVPDETHLRRPFSSLITRSFDSLYALASKDKYLVKSEQPAIQLQRHHFFYSTLDHKIHSMVLSQQSVTWGIQFSYPQLFQDKDTHQIKTGRECQNAPLFGELSRWMRRSTLPTPFILEGTLTYAPLRIGKKALSWVSNHPQLIAQGIRVKT